MTNKEKYKEAFSVLHASDDISLEVEKMQKNKRNSRRKQVIAACACVAIVAGSMTAYATDLAGIQSRIHGWIHGELKSVDVTSETDGSYTFTWTEDGTTQEVSGGGVSMNASGEQTALSANEVLEGFSTSVETDDDGTIWLYFESHKVDITEYLSGSSKSCKVAIQDNETTTYFDIKSNGSGGYSLSYSDSPEGSADAYTIVS
ncbi:MAG: hypothetical protein LUG99_00895 [Lachnospiraceae bacterium]|nr:hypothetical protein [Lachnospiraceae bacterium]